MNHMGQEIKHKANGKALTLNELAAFVQHALRSGADGTEAIKGAITFSGKIKDIAIGITAPTPANPDTQPGG
ncbi:hypothetical protein [Streptomyces cucumeris]|uniref:hypothetical protein n=1 Tax=Streptomyces cucumeris TaxID=2962890 RepID=UPI0020C85704|nr:hypothetical protein [Streptomyces sp. NEAU-Y11]MCP9205512.1 hypothetical protein [Streptomyces sp. NEAU-Y11]